MNLSLSQGLINSFKFLSRFQRFKFYDCERKKVNERSRVRKDWLSIDYVQFLFVLWYDPHRKVFLLQLCFLKYILFENHFTCLLGLLSSIIFFQTPFLEGLLLWLLDSSSSFTLYRDTTTLGAFMHLFILLFIQYTIIKACMYFLMLHTHRTQYLLRLIITFWQHVFL